MSVTTKRDARVWIELERPQSNEEGERRAELGSFLLERLGHAPGALFWSESSQRYCYVASPGGAYTELSDGGHYFSLEHFGRPTLRQRVFDALDAAEDNGYTSFGCDDGATALELYDKDADIARIVDEEGTSLDRVAEHAKHWRENFMTTTEEET